MTDRPRTMSLKPPSKEIEENESKLRIEALGVSVTDDMTPLFSKMIRKCVKSGVVDITDWTPAGIRALLQVCSEDNLRITLKHNGRYFMLATSSTKQGIDNLATAIVEGCL
jgi:hypothetical protein